MGKKVYEPHPKAAKRRQSAIVILKALLALNGDDAVLESHLKKFVSNCLWKITLAEGPSKYETRYRSEASYDAPKRKLQHEHVWQRKLMVQKLLKCQPDQVEEIVNDAVGCTVTKEEHQRLADVDKADPDVDGWERYRRAEITVRDMLTGKKVSL